MAEEEVLEEHECSVAEYLAQFDSDAPDHAWVRARSENWVRVVVRRVRVGAADFEDTEVFEKSGSSYTVRVRLDA